MKIKLFAVLIALAQTFHAQEITGSWKGELNLSGMKLPLILKITKENGHYISVAKSPKQSDSSIPVDKTAFADQQLTFEINSINASYKGQFRTDHFEGIFTQHSFSVPLALYRNNDSKDTEVQPGALKKTVNTGKIDDFLNYVAANKQATGSISIFREGKKMYHRDFGQNQLSPLPWSSSTGYQIGSVSKMITAVMLMQLEEQGKIQLSDRLSKYYPDVPNAGKITLKQMMNHTSGLGDYVGEHYQWLFGKYVGDQAILDTIKKQGVSFQPGEKTRYSNSGYYLLSRILEKVAQKPYHILLKEHITGKAGMKNTFSVLDHPSDVFRSYENTDGKWTEIQDFDFRNCIGLGDITSTPEDMSIFINALFSNMFLKKESLEKMLPEKGQSFGLGIMPIPFYNKVSFGHGGDTAGTHTFVSYSPAEKYSFVLMVNGEKMPHNDLAIGILSILYDLEYPYPQFSQANKIPATELQQYAGEYRSEDIPLGLKIFVKDGVLFAEGTGQPSFPLENNGKNEFSFDKAGIKIRFIPGKKQLQLLQGGATYLFTGK